MVLFREAAGHMVQASTACTWMGSAMPNSSIGISSVIPRSGVGKQKQYTRLGTVGEFRPRQVKAIFNELELETLGCRIDGNAGVIAPPRSVVSRLIGRTAWFARNPTKRRHTAGNSWRPLESVVSNSERRSAACLSTVGIGSIDRRASHAEGLS